MNRQEFISKISEKTGQTKTFTKEYIDILESTIFDLLVDGDKVDFAGVAFDTESREERLATNPRDPNGAKLLIPAKRNVKIKKKSTLKTLLK